MSDVAVFISRTIVALRLCSAALLCGSGNREALRQLRRASARGLTGRSEHQSRSSVSADGEWCDILINISPDSLRIYENGRNVLARARSGTVSGSFDIVCELDELETFEADLMDFRICPVAVGQDQSALLSTATELQFNTASRDLNAQCFSVRQFDSPVKVAYTDSSLRFSTPSLTKYVPPTLFRSLLGGIS